MVLLMLAVRKYDSCGGAGMVDYFATASCVGQALEKTFPYTESDSNICPASAERDNMKAALALRWAFVPRTDTDMSRAVTAAPVQIGVDASSNAFAAYTGGIVPCGTLGGNCNRE
jgi:hypothetical protein